MGTSLEEVNKWAPPYCVDKSGGTARVEMPRAKKVSKRLMYRAFYRIRLAPAGRLSRVTLTFLGGSNEGVRAELHRTEEIIRRN